MYQCKFNIWNTFTPTERLRIRSDGNVDINGTPPWTVTGGDYVNLSISGGTASSSGFLWLGNGAATTNADFDLARINISNNDTIVARISGSTQTSADDDGRISFFTKATGGSLTERVRIDSNGHVTKPYQFHIEVSRTNDQTGYNAGGDFGTPMIFDNVVTTIGTTNAALDTSTGKITVPVAGVYFLEAAVVSSADNFQQAWFTEGASRMHYSDHVHAGDTTSYTNRIQVSGMHYLSANVEVGFKPYGSGQSNVTIQDSIYHTWFRVTLMG